MDLITVEQLKHCMPIRIYWQDEEAFVDWCYMDGARLLEPFFDQTIESCFTSPFNLLFRHQTPLEVLGELYRQSRGLPLKGLIFHMSRCGSTLVSQMLGNVFDIDPYVAQFFGGTSMLITVGVLLDTMRQMETHLLMRHYDGFLKNGRLRGRF